MFAQSRGPRPIFGKLLCEFCQKKYVMSLILEIQAVNYFHDINIIAKIMPVI